MSKGANAGGGERSWEMLVYAAQFFFGGWFLFHGLNHWMHFFPQPPGSASISSQVIGSLIKSGLFDWVKGLEVVAGIALLLNRFVPLAAVASFPISFVIGYLNIAVESDANALFVFFGVLGLNGIIALGHLDRLLPMIAPGNIAPNLTGLREAFGFSVKSYAEAATQPGGAFSSSARHPLPAHLHVLGIVLGIAAPAILTLTTLPKAGEPGAALPAPTDQPQAR